MTISSFNRIIVDCEALQHNFSLIRQSVAENVDVMAMVKSDGYGHGMIFAAAAFARAGCRSFGVAELREGVELRESGCLGEIIIFTGFEHCYVDYFFSHHLIPLVFSRDDLSVLASAARKNDCHLDIFLKLDCGMSRLGFKPAEVESLVDWVKKEQYIGLKGFVTHFPCSDDTESENTGNVYSCFSQACDGAADVGALKASACNSGGTLYFPEAHGNMVRNGISLYGYYPDGAPGRPEDPLHGLRPAMTFMSRVVQVNEIETGAGVSYGHTYIAERDMKLAVIPVGYSDGYPRALSNRAEVLIRGCRAPIRGRICMNMCMADVTDIDGVKPGDEVVLLGSQGKETIDADEVGGWCDTISYEILCALGNSNERVS